VRRYDRKSTRTMLAHSKVHIREHMIEGQFKGWHIKPTIYPEVDDELKVKRVKRDAKERCLARLKRLGMMGEMSERNNIG